VQTAGHLVAATADLPPAGKHGQHRFPGHLPVAGWMSWDAAAVVGDFPPTPSQRRNEDFVAHGPLRASSTELSDHLINEVVADPLARWCRCNHAPGPALGRAPRVSPPPALQGLDLLAP